MREILFRGKRADNGKWVEGLPIRTYDTEIGKNSVDYANPVPVVLMASGRIVLECGYDEVPFFNTDKYPIVNPDTISQFTGLKDRNGTKIFAGDIVKTKYGRLCEVRWFSSPCSQCWDLIPIEATQKAPDSYDVWASKNLEVVGNVHDGGATAE